MKTVRVLIVDDHAVVRRGLRDVLEHAPGIEVVGEAADGSAAVRLSARHEPEVVILDITMPGMDGVAAAQRIRERSPGVAILALTMHDDRAHLSRMLDAGAAGYVLKRSAPDELVRAVRAVASGNTYVDPLLAGHVLSRRSGNVTVAGSPEVLSDREEEVLRGVAWGHSNKEIGRQLGVSPRTVETYRARIADKLGIRTRNEIVRYALQHGWLSAD